MMCSDKQGSTVFVWPYGYLYLMGTYNPDSIRYSLPPPEGADVNTEYQAPCYSDDAFFGSGFSRRRSSVHAVRNVTLLTPLSPGPSPTGGGAAVAMCSAEDHKLLLHIAIEKNHLEMVAYLISQNADVSVNVTTNTVYYTVLVVIFLTVVYFTNLAIIFHFKNYSFANWCCSQDFIVYFTNGASTSEILQI